MRHPVADTAARYVTSPDGTRLAVYEAGTGPTIVAVHGYPDNHTVWDGVTRELTNRYRVVTYDVRGTGASDQPRGRASYRMPQLLADLRAVLDAVSPGEPVHLLGHDWGSVQCWAAVNDSALDGRITSFTSISGPSLDHAAAWLRRGHRHAAAAARQLLDSYYVALFQLPLLPELAWRSGRLDRLLARVERRDGTSPASGAPARRTEADKINGLQLYRANVLTRLGSPAPRRTDVPVLVLAPRRDPFITVAMQTQAPVPYTTDLRTRVVDGGHWVVTDQPEVVAQHVADFAGEVDGRRGNEP